MILCIVVALAKTKTKTTTTYGLDRCKQKAIHANATLENINSIQLVINGRHVPKWIAIDLYARFVVEKRSDVKRGKTKTG